MKIKIFIIDDNLTLQKIYNAFLSLHGFHIIGRALNGQTAIELLKDIKEQPDLIIVDYHMPVKNGIETTKEIREYNKEVKIIFISADNKIKELAFSVGATCFLEKPFDFKELIGTITYCSEKYIAPIPNY
ncbi:MAG: response regulator [Promethearchaeia archaeon]